MGKKEINMSLDRENRINVEVGGKHTTMKENGDIRGHY